MELPVGESLVFDAYAWVEYALDGPNADVVAAYLEGPSPVLTPASVVAELTEAMLRDHVETKLMDRVLAFVRSRSLVIAVDADVARRAGELNHERKKKVKGWGMLDSFVYAVTLLHGGKVVTGDQHFMNLKNAVYLGVS